MARGRDTKTPQGAYEILTETLEVSQASWPIVAGALSTLRADKAWKAVAGQGETWGEFLSQLPGEPMGPDKASKLIQLFEEFVIKQKIDAGVLAGAPWSKLYVTLQRVKKGEVSAKRAIGDAQTILKDELEEQYRDDPDKPLDASSEPHKCECPDCGAIHRRRMRGRS